MKACACRKGGIRVEQAGALQSSVLPRGPEGTPPGPQGQNRVSEETWAGMEPGLVPGWAWAWGWPGQRKETYTSLPPAGAGRGWAMLGIGRLGWAGQGSAGYPC